MDLFYNPLRTRPIRTGRVETMEPDPNRQFGFIDNPDRQSGTGSVPTRTRTRSDGPDPLLTLGQPQRKRESWGKDADISHESTPVVGSGPYTGILLGTHPQTHTDKQFLRRQAREGMGPGLRYNLSWSSHYSPLFTIPADVAAPQEQEFGISGVVGCLPHIYGANDWQNQWPNKQLEVGQPPCLWGSSWLLQSWDNQLGEG